MKIGVFGNLTSPRATAAMIGDFGRRAEAAGLDSIWLGEHVVLFDDMEFPYPGSRDGRIPMPKGGGMLDTVATFGYLAAVTSTLRFGTGITLLPQRNPVYTANEFATLDWLSEGRMDFGIGVGWCKEEVLACGYSWHDRGKRCDEFLELIQQLWSQDVVQFKGEHIEVAGAKLDPKPVQAVLPTIVGGHSKAAIRRAVKYGQGWYGFALSPELTAPILKDIDLALAEAGRSRSDFEIVITPGSVKNDDVVREFKALGVDRLVVQLGSNRAENVDTKLAELESMVLVADG